MTEQSVSSRSWFTPVWKPWYRGFFLHVWGLRLDLVWVTKDFRERGW